MMMIYNSYTDGRRKKNVRTSYCKRQKKKIDHVVPKSEIYLKNIKVTRLVYQRIFLYRKEIYMCTAPCCTYSCLVRF